jgi:hypothetical protein
VAQSGDATGLGQSFLAAAPLGSHSQAFHDWWLADDPAAAALDRSHDVPPVAVVAVTESLPAPLERF